MAEDVIATHAPHESAASDVVGLFNFLIDPAAAATRLPRRFFWITPLLLVSAVAIACGIYNLPIAQQALVNQAPPPNVPPEQFQRMGMMGIRVGMYLTPIIVVVFAALSALIVVATAAVLDVKARFLELFNFVLGLTIFFVLQLVVTSIVLHLQGEPSGLSDLQPALGLDIFAPAGTGKALVAFLGYFNIFQIWQIVMSIFILSAAYRIGKGRAAMLVTPMYALGLLMKIGGALLSRTP